MRGAWTEFSGEEEKKTTIVQHCQLVLYSRRSLMIHYGADVSRVLVLRGI